MASVRPSIFNDALDLSDFAPKAEPTSPSVPPETVRKVSEEGGFPSRSPTVPIGQGFKRKCRLQTVASSFAICRREDITPLSLRTPTWKAKGAWDICD